MSRPKPSCSEEPSGLSPNARLVYISPDMLGLWRLRKSLALDDARWAIGAGRKDIATQYVLGARFHHHEIMRIRVYLRTRQVLPALPVEKLQPIPVKLTLEKARMAKPLPGGLSPREEQFVKQLASGKAMAEIAGSLGIRLNTAYVYKSTAAAKLGIKVSALQPYVMQQGWAA